MRNKPKKKKDSKNIGLKYDREGDTLYLIIKEGPEDNFIELAPDINLEFNKEGEIIGFEILHFTNFIENKDDFKISDLLKSLS